MSPRAKTVPIALTIAGSDSGGGAGVQADLKTFHQYGVFGTSVIVAVTAQNTVRGADVHEIPGAMVTSQMQALADDLPPAAVKTGMLATPELVDLVATNIERFAFPCLVVDPVMVATSGDRLLSPDAERVITQRLLPLATLVTPNLDEARLLLNTPIEGIGDGAALVARQRQRHRVHREVAAKQILLEGAGVYGRQRSGSLVGFDAGGGDVDTEVGAFQCSRAEGGVYDAAYVFEAGRDPAGQGGSVSL